jgi:hypothetical protein
MNHASDNNFENMIIIHKQKHDNIWATGRGCERENKTTKQHMKSVKREDVGATEANNAGNGNWHKYMLAERSSS